MEHLTSDEIQAVTALLHARARELGHDLRDEIDDASAQRRAQVDEGAVDRADQAQAETNTEREAGMVGHYATELADVEAALARIRAGVYGVCIDCGEAVPHARLRAYPTAKRCVHCQQLRERRPGHTGVR